MNPSPTELLLKEGNTSVCPIRWEDGVLYLLDQRLLPEKEIWLSYRSPDKVALAIKDMVVRGAPAIGITAAFGMVLSAIKNRNKRDFKEFFHSDAKMMLQARPTAVNLRWAVERLGKVLTVNPQKDPGEAAELLEKEALSIWEEDIRACISMGRFGAALLPEKGGVLTHCNAGGLATGGYGTALGVIRAAVTSGKEIKVFADETRPWLQGARLTAWELIKDGIPVTLIVDSAAGFMMQRGEIQAVVVGADRIAANGDVANKIGTYSLAILAKAHNIPFYVAAPLSTIDLSTSSGEEIPVEERSQEEITHFQEKFLSTQGVQARNPVFDITQSHLVTAIITERGVLTFPYETSISALFENQ